MKKLPYIQTSMSNLLGTDILQVMSLSDTHSPLASSSQISKNAIRSYLQWQGPAVERVSVLSFVAGTGGRQRQSSDMDRPQDIVKKWVKISTHLALTKA